MESYYFVGCPYYKDDIIKKLHGFYPNEPISKFRKKGIRQLRIIYAKTIKKFRLA